MKQNLVIAKPNDKLYSQFSNSNKNTQSRQGLEIGRAHV